MSLMHALESAKELAQVALGCEQSSSFSSVLPPVTMKTSCTATPSAGRLRFCDEQLAIGEELVVDCGEEQFFIVRHGCGLG